MHGVKSSAVNSLHSNIAKVVRDVTEASLQIVSSSHPHGWTGIGVDEAIEFELGTIPDRQPNVLHERIDRDLGGRTFVFRLVEQPEEEATLWAGWYDQWKAVGDGTFDLVALSWTFYWGFYYRPRKAILRAEWDSLHYRNQRAAQPHWHIDPGLLVDSYRPIVVATPLPVPEAAGDLIELEPEEMGLVEIPDPTGIQELSMTGMHLAMGGWTNANAHPGCWRVRLPANWADVTRWVERTLVYAREQFVKEFHQGHPIE
ncbi:MAG: hypothetical protein ACLQU5_25195 [Isosphaeraceae bacterium]